MARIPYPKPEDMSPENRKFHDKLPELNLLRMLAGSPSMLIPLARLFSSYLNDGVLDTALRETVILRVGHLCNSEYEVTHHLRVAKLIGMDPEKVAALSPQAPQDAFTDEERLILRFVDEQVLEGGASAETFAAAAQQLSVEELIELSAVIGVYTMVSQFCASFGIELEDAPLPDTGITDMKQSVDKLD